EMKDTTPRLVLLEFYATPARLYDRIRWCWRMLTRGVGFEHEFVVRPEDVNDLARVIVGGENDGAGESKGNS
ncbi:MAG: hypothetical protein ACE5JA_10560, partial [bacterium]